MTKPIDLSIYTTGESATTVSVGDFRKAIEHLERVCNVDYHSARQGAERAQWREIARRVGVELIGLTCKRATVADWDRRERALERSTKLLTKGV